VFHYFFLREHGEAMGNSFAGNNTTASKSIDITNNMDPNQFIEKEITSHPIVIFSKTYCPYCTQTKRMFANQQYAEYPAVTHELDKIPGGDAIQQALAKKTGQRTVPSVFVNGQHVGGNDDAQSAHSTGKIGKLLAAYAAK
jgi:glutaredoxin 3